MKYASSTFYGRLAVYKESGFGCLAEVYWENAQVQVIHFNVETPWTEKSSKLKISLGLLNIVLLEGLT